MSLLVLLGFRSSNNADLFLNNPNYQMPLQATQAKVNQGYTPPPPTPSTAFGSPGSSDPGVSPDGWVVIYVDTLPQIPPLYQPLVQLIVDTSNNNIIYNSPNIDTSTINLTTPDSTIFQNGVPPPSNNVPQAPLNNQLPFDFQPIYPDVSIQPVSDVPLNPNVLRDPSLNQSIDPFDEHNPQNWVPSYPPETFQDQPIQPNPNAWNPPLNFDTSDPNVFPDVFLPRPQGISYDPNSDTIELPEIDVTAPPPGEGWEQVPGDQFETIAPRDPVYVRPLPALPGTGEGGGTSGTATVFIGFVDAVFGSGNNPAAISNAQMYFSPNGIGWFLTQNPVSGYQDLKSPRLAYGNGTFMCSFTYTYAIDQSGSRLTQDVCVSSSNGINWSIVMTADAVNQASNIVKSFNSLTNVWTLTNGAIQKTFTIVNPASPALNGDFISHAVGPMASPNWFATGASVLQNTLPSGFTAVRNNFDSTGSGFDFTSTSISTGVVNSGSGWPLATWVTLFNSNPTGNSQGVVSPFFGAVYSAIGAPLIAN